MSESGPQSAIYHASVYHARVRPKRHALRYRVFYLLLDLDRLGALDQGSRLFAYNRTGLVSFHDRDHGDGSGRPAADWVRAKLAEAGLEAAGHRIFALTLPRLFGYVFNPITVYYGYRRDGSLGAVLYEVNNTFGDRHGYLVGISSAGASQRHRHRHGAPKAMHVSPFNRVEGRYDFKIVEPMEGLPVALDCRARDEEKQGVACDRPELGTAQNVPR